MAVPHSLHCTTISLDRTMVDNQANAAEAKLAALSYQGEKRGWSFESYCRSLHEQFTILNNLKDFGHSGIDARSQVRRLNDGIRVDELKAVKSTILATPLLRTDLEACITLYRDYIAQSKSMSFSRNISTVESSGGGGTPRTGSRTGTRMPYEQFKDADVEDVYYERDAYRALSAKQKAKLHWLRSKRTDKSGGGKSKSGGKQQSKRKFNLSNRQIKEIATAAAKMKISDDSDDDSEPTTNRNNPALIRNKTAKKRKQS